MRKIILLSLVSLCVMPGLVLADGADALGKLFEKAAKVSTESTWNDLADKNKYYWHPEDNHYTAAIACDNGTTVGYSINITNVEDTKRNKYTSLLEQFTIPRPCKLGDYMFSASSARPLEQSFYHAVSIGVGGAQIMRWTRPNQNGKGFSSVTATGLLINNKLLGAQPTGFGYAALSVVCAKTGNNYGAIAISGQKNILGLLNGKKTFSQIISETPTPKTEGIASTGKLLNGCGPIDEIAAKNEKRAKKPARKATPSKK